MELTVEKRKQKHKLAFKDISSRYITLEFPCHTFFRTIGQGSCSAKFGSLRKNVSFSTLSFKFRISIKCIVSTSLFWKYSVNPLVDKLYNKRKKNGREKKIQEATLCQKQKSRAVIRIQSEFHQNRYTTWHSHHSQGTSCSRLPRLEFLQNY